MLLTKSKTNPKGIIKNNYESVVLCIAIIVVKLYILATLLQLIVKLCIYMSLAF